MESLENAARKWSSDRGADEAGQLIPVHVDISDKKSIEELYKQISQKEEQLHLLVNNVRELAGIVFDVLSLSLPAPLCRPVSLGLLDPSRRLPNPLKP